MQPLTTIAVSAADGSTEQLPGFPDESLAEYIDHSLDHDHAEKDRWRTTAPLPPGSPQVI